MLLRNPSIPWMEEKISGAEMRRRGEARTTLYFLLPHLTPPLVRLEIDGALMPWILLPKLTWPRLETLILSGEHPIISNAKQFPSQPSSVQQSFPPQMQENTQPGPANQIPLITLLGGMRELKNLQFRWIHNPQRRFYIMEPKNRPHPGPPLPQGVPHTPLSADPTNPFNPGHSSPLMLPGSTPPGLLPTSSPSLATPPLARPGLSTAFPHLKSLTLSNPAEDDDCFANLPPSLEYLYLPIITRASVRPNGITPQALARILTAVKQCPLQLRGIQLTLHNHLPTPKLFGGLASCLPYLRTMEIGVMCYDGRRDAGEWAAYVEAIRNFPHLIGLNIAVPFPHNNTRVGCLGSDPEEYRFAHYLATHLPNLQYVALQSVAKLYDTDSPAFAYPPGNPSQAWVGEWNNWSRYDVYRRRVAVPGPGGGMGMGMGGGWIPMVDVRWNEAYTMTSPSSNA
ncbi:hypothetical protein AX16_005095 [Volvariella volvacea WC 439]|nr:hypothetical protein AX16_005095 [Volvariella volvacea WC 439]